MTETSKAMDEKIVSKIMTIDEYLETVKSSDVHPMRLGDFTNQFGPIVMKNRVFFHGKENEIAAFCALYESNNDDTVVPAMQSIVTYHDLVMIRRRFEKTKSFDYDQMEHANVHVFDLNDCPFGDFVAQTLNYSVTEYTKLIAKFYFIEETGEFIKSETVYPVCYGKFCFLENNDISIKFSHEVELESSKFVISSFSIDPQILDEIEDPATPSKNAN